MTGKLFSFICTRRDGNHIGVELASSLNVRRGVTNEADTGTLAQPGFDFGNGVAEDINTQLVFVTETTEAEELAQPGSFDLVPTDGLQVPLGDSQQFAGRLEGSENFRDSTTDGGIKGTCVCVHLSADDLQSGG